VPGERPVGRRAELGRIGAFLDAATETLRSLAVAGPPGIGKTTVLREGVRQAEECGFRVLSARPTGAEARLSFAALGDLLAPLDEELFAVLPAPQRRAIDIALLRHDLLGGKADGRVVSTALLSLLRELARRGPILLAVDDAQWLDGATAETLAFAVRRLQELPLGILVSVRVEGVRPLTFERVVTEDRREEVVLGPLSVGALHDVVKRELGLTFPRPLLVRVVSECRGNPFYALEIARELARSGVPSPREPLPLPAQIRSLTRARLARFPRRTQEALLAAASLSRPTVSLVDVEALVPAEEAGIVHVGRDGEVRFAHPLFASAVYDAAPAGSRRRAHRRLAELVSDPEERARHLALVANRPDEAVAEALEEAAARAASRGASAAAAELAGRALELTVDPRGERGVRRAIDAARHLLDVGESAEAAALLAAVDQRSLEPDFRATLLYEQGKISWYERDFERGYGLLLEAAQHARDPELLAAVHVQAAWVAQEVDPLQAIPHTDAVLSLVDPETRPGRYSQALLHGAYLRLVSGQGADLEAYDRGCELQRRNSDWNEVSPVPGMFPLLVDDFERSREFYEPGLVRSREEGDEMSVQGTLLRLVEIHLWTGNWAAADELADEGMQLADRISSRAYLGSALYSRGYVDAHLGRVDEARAEAERILALFPEPVEQVARAVAHWILGFLALSVDDPAAAAGQLDCAATAVSALNQREPARFRFDGDHVEALIRIGELDRAEGLIAALDERGRILPRPWTLAVAARSRALLLSARGDLDAAVAAMEDALRHHEGLAMPFERARTLLELGRLRRRRKERRNARSALVEALAVFEELGALLWTERARAELARVPVRRVSGDLTPTETTIASLAATGLTNRAIAERIYVSPKTVESNLARVYRKLGIRSRAELGRAMAERERLVGT
jgi:DNA-binding CsgD family transcriptional regulator